MYNAFFRTFWVLFIGLIGLLGLALAMTAGMALAGGSMPSFVVATMMTGACAVLCGAAHTSLRQISGS